MKREKKRTFKKKGGLRIAPEYLEQGYTSWQLIWMIISHPDTTAISLAYSSLKGFLFLVRIPPPLQRVFLDLNDAGTAFNKPCETLVLKFGVLKNTGREEDLTVLPIIDGGHPNGVEKQTDGLVNFAMESSVQQKIYTSTVGQRGQPVCPAVVDFSYFLSKPAQTLLRELELKCQGNSLSSINARKMTTFLIQQLRRKPAYMLGLITMQVGGRGFTGLSDLAGEPSYDEACLHVIDQFLRLTMQARVANYDCHAGNILAKLDGTKTYLIDFGRIVSLLPSGNILSSFDIDEQASIRLVYRSINPTLPNDLDTDYAEINRMISQGTIYLTTGRYVDEDMVVDRMNKIIEFIAKLDMSISHELFGVYRPQMNSVLQSFYGPTAITDNWTITPPDFTITDDVSAKYKRVIEFFAEETNASLQRSATTPGNIRALIDAKALFSDVPITRPAPYNRGDIAQWVNAAVAPAPAASAAPLVAPAAPLVAPAQPSGDTVCDQLGNCINRAVLSLRRRVIPGGRKTKQRNKQMYKKNHKKTHKR
jgi:hypothetical protein